MTKAPQEAMRKLIAKVAASEKHFNALGTAGVLQNDKDNKDVGSKRTQLSGCCQYGG